MTWPVQWQAISARIDGLTAAGEMFAHTVVLGGNDSYGTLGNFVMPELIALRSLLSEFQKIHGHSLPKNAADALDRFTKHRMNVATTNERWGATLIVPFVVFKSEFEYLIRDADHIAREQTELRKVVVCRKNWMFYGSDTHAQSAAAIFSIIASCRLHGIEPQQYLDEILRLLPYWPRDRYLELAPKNWLGTRAKLNPLELAVPLGSFTVPEPRAAHSNAFARAR